MASFQIMIFENIYLIINLDSNSGKLFAFYEVFKGNIQNNLNHLLCGRVLINLGYLIACFYWNIRTSYRSSWVNLFKPLSNPNLDTCNRHVLNEMRGLS